MGKIILLRILLGIWSLGSVSTVAADDWAVMSELQETVKAVMKEIAAIKNITSSAVTVEKPVLTKEPQMYKKWARISEEWDEIFAHEENYPENLLDNLKRNPEILEFVYEYPDAPLRSTGGMTVMEKLQTVPLFMQWDSRWGYVPYGSYNIGISGCGPTCLSMILYHYLGDESLTPPVLAKKGMDGGYYVPDAGTAWTYLVNIPQEYGLDVRQYQIVEESAMIELLEKGGLMVCSMEPGDFTDKGHFIVICGYDEEGFRVNDPFSYTNSYKRWDYEILAKQIKQVWCYTYHVETFSSGN